MKILKMIGLVVAVHAVVLTFGFILPGCQSSAARTSPSTAAPKTSESNLSRIEAARAATTVGQPAAQTASRAPAGNRGAPPPAAQTGDVPFTGGPVTNFGVPLPAPAPAVEAGAAALPAEQPPEPPAALTYTVVANDSLSRIAKKFKVTVNEIAAANNISTRATIQIGQKLKIPAKIDGRPGASATSALPGTLVYKVKPGDSLDAIARRHNTTVAQIKTLNKLTGVTIRIDQELLIPVAVDAAPAPSSAAAAEQPAASSKPAFTVVHTVKPGETLDRIAMHYGASRNEIATTNHITDPRRLQAGQRLTITSAKKNLTTAASPAATAPAAPPAPAPMTTPPPPPPVEASPVSPVTPVDESPVSPAAPPVNTPQDPVASPIGIPQNAR